MENRENTEKQEMQTAAPFVPLLGTAAPVGMGSHCYKEKTRGSRMMTLTCRKGNIGAQKNRVDVSGLDVGCGLCVRQRNIRRISVEDAHHVTLVLLFVMIYPSLEGSAVVVDLTSPRSAVTSHSPLTRSVTNENS